ncbi:hypothetical protein [Actinomadura sp. 9N215]|uniref:hypothetical protein n=1 Tax=Actinomadura sp. 9N215 TaxID=3375150 RepID=UPI0037989BD6
MGVEQSRTVRVEIGELVFDGFDHRVDPDLVSAAFERELDRLIRARGVPLADADRRLDTLTGLPPLPATTSPGRLGRALARAVHVGLSGQGRAS